MAFLSPVLLLLTLTPGGPGQALDPAVVQARYLRARVLAGSGKLGAASEELELLAHKSPELADRCAYEAAGLYEKRGALRKASALYAAVSERSYFYSEARLALARVERLRGDLDAAAAAAMPLAASAVSSERRRALVELAAIATLKHDEVGHRDLVSRLAAERAPWLGGAPALSAIAGGYDALLKSTACRAAHRAVFGVSPELGCVRGLLTAEASACDGRNVSVELKQLTRQCRQPWLASRAWMTLGLLEARDGKAQDAAASFRRAATEAPAAPLAAEALFAAFWVGWKAHPADATGADLAAEEALPVKLSAQDRARLAYWRSRVAQVHGAPAEEARLLSEVAVRYPASWYGSLARERLASFETTPASPVDLADTISSSDRLDEREALEHLRPGIAAMQLGLDDGAAELTTLALRHPSAAGNRLTVELLEAAGNGSAAYRFARTVFRQQAGERQDASVWQAAFPAHFSELIARHADRAEVEPPLLQGLVREESAFEPTARSHCGALGLMQLMPVTARSVAHQAGADLDDLGALLDPQRNIELGSRYYGQLLRRFDGNRVAATAAYNGGPTRVASWLKLPSAARPDEWVEEIPLDETRNYVKDVLASADVYRHRLAARSVIIASLNEPSVGAEP